MSAYHLFVEAVAERVAEGPRWVAMAFWLSYCALWGWIASCFV